MSERIDSGIRRSIGEQTAPSSDSLPGQRRRSRSLQNPAQRRSYLWVIRICLLVAAALISGAAPPSRAAGNPTVIADWGGDYVTTDTSMARYITVEYPVDLDGGNDDARAYLPYSDSEPINPHPEGPNAYGTTYARGTSYRFYGGILFQHYNGLFGSKWAEVWYRDGLDRIYQSADATSDGWALLYWKKEDFLNDASSVTVTFDVSSTLEILNYAGADGLIDNNFGRVRFVVRDGSQFYISEIFGDKATSSGFQLNDPSSTSWALYTPSAPYNLKFDAVHAVFAHHIFSDITAVGFYHTTDQSSAANRRAGLNIERFRVSAKLQTPTPIYNYHIALPLCIR